MKSASFALLVIVAVIVCGMLLPSQATAQKEEIKILAGEDEKPVTEASYIPDTFDIAISGLLFFRIRTAAAGFTAAERARIIETRLVHAISFGDISPEAVTIRPVRGKPTIYIDNIRIVTVYARDVEAAGARSREHLARMWADSIAEKIVKVAPWWRMADRLEH